MSSNHNRVCRDGLEGSLQIKSHKVLDHNANLDVREANVQGHGKIKENLTDLGDVTVKGDMINN